MRSRVRRWRRDPWGFLWRIPRLVVPTLATVIGAGLWHYLVPEQFKAWRGSLLATAIVALLVSMLVTSLVHPMYQSVFETLPPNEP
jgi:hypothetical protein